MSFRLQNTYLKNAMSKILITGGAGFIGAHLANILKKDNKIMIVDNLENKGGISFIDRSSFFVKGNILDKKILKKMISKIPLKRIGEKSEVAEMIYFLCSEKGNYVNGALINISGGSILD